MDEAIKNALEDYLKEISLKELKSSSFSLSKKYKEKEYRLSTQEKKAYVATRMPATYAVIKKCFQELKNLHISIFSYLDLGAGPGTSAFAAYEVFENMQNGFFFEKEEDFITLGKTLTKDLFPIHWQKADLTQEHKFPEADLWLLSYVANELSKKSIEEIINSFEKSSSSYLLLIEPGTAEAFKKILEIRKALLLKNLHLIAPCPHAKSCPIKEPSWCHFFAHVQRTKEHMFAKEGSLGFEDEKFCYLLFSKKPISTLNGRILSSPMKRSGHVKISLCTEKGLIEKTISKKDKELYKTARDSSWGDSFLFIE